MSGAHVQGSGLQVLDNVIGPQVITMPGNFTAGSTGVLLISIFPASPTAVTINGITATKVASQIDGGDGICFAEVWVADGLPGGTATATVTLGSSSYIDCSVEEFSGLSNPAYSASATNSNTGPDGNLAISVTSPTWAQADMVVVGVVSSATGRPFGGGDAFSAVPGSPWTEAYRQGDGSSHQVGEGTWRIVTSTSPVTPSWTIDQGNGAHGNGAVVVGLLVATASPPSPVVVFGSNSRSAPELPPTALFRGVAPAVQPKPPQVATQPPSRLQELPPTARVVKGFGQAAQPPRLYQDPYWGEAVFDPVALPPVTRSFKGVAPAAAAAVATIAFARMPPVPDGAGAMLFTGIEQVDQPSFVAQAPVVRFVALPPQDSIVKGFGQAAQRPAVYQDPFWSDAAFDPVKHPPTPRLLKGFGQALPPDRLLPLSGFESRPPIEAARPSLFVGVAVAANAPIAVVFAARAECAPVELPPVPSSGSGFGQSPPPDRLVSFSSFDPRPSVEAATPRWYAGVAPIAPQSIPVMVARVAPSASLPPFDSVVKGFGFPSYPATVAVGTPPSLALLVVGRVVVGAGQVVLPVPPIFAARSPAPVAELPPRDSVVKGFGLPATAPYTLAAANPLLPVELLTAGRLVAGFGQLPQPAPPAVIAAPRLPSEAELPPVSGSTIGYGQAAQPPVTYFATVAVGPVALAPASALFAGVVPSVFVPTVAVVYRATTVQTAETPPKPLAIRGFGQAAQKPAVVTAPVVAPPVVGTPLLATLVKGFGQAAQVAATYGPPWLTTLMATPPAFVQPLPGFGKFVALSGLPHAMASSRQVAHSGAVSGQVGRGRSRR